MAHIRQEFRLGPAGFFRAATGDAQIPGLASHPQQGGQGRQDEDCGDGQDQALQSCVRARGLQLGATFGQLVLHVAGDLADPSAEDAGFGDALGAVVGAKLDVGFRSPALGEQDLGLDMRHLQPRFLSVAVYGDATADLRKVAPRGLDLSGLGPGDGASRQQLRRQEGGVPQVLAIGRQTSQHVPRRLCGLGHHGAQAGVIDPQAGQACAQRQPVMNLIQAFRLFDIAQLGR